MPNQILLKGLNVERWEYPAAAAITPGHLIELDGSDAVQVHSTAGGNHQRMVAIEESFIGNDIDNAYAADDQVQFVIAKPGVVAYMLLADGNNVSQGDALQSNGAGLLEAHTAQAVDEGGSATYTVYVNGSNMIALEDVNASGSDERIRVLFT